MHACRVGLPSTACVYVSTRMNACMQVPEPAFGLGAADPFAGVHVCMHACRHGQPTVAVTPLSLSISLFCSSSPFVDRDKQNRKCLLAEQMLHQLEQKRKNATWQPCCWLTNHPKCSPKGHNNEYRSCPTKIYTLGASSVGHGSLISPAGEEQMELNWLLWKPEIQPVMLTHLKTPS